MALARLNGVQLYYEVTGEGFPLVFSHEFAGDYRSWEAQTRFFSRRYQVITYNHRGFPPSSVPTDPDAYSQDHNVEDCYKLLCYLNISRAHIVGLSMGGSVTLSLGLKHPEVCASMVVASCGTGSVNPKEFEYEVRAVADQLLKDGMKNVATSFGAGPGRVQLLRKDPRAYQEFLKQFIEHDALGSALTFLGVQLRRPTIFSLEAELNKLQIPTLLLIGDEDEPCVKPAIFMKQSIPSSGLVIFPQSGHTINLEEPDLFNRVVSDFLTAVEAKKWVCRGPVSVVPSTILPDKRLGK